MDTNITNNDDTIDSRQVIDRITELTDLRDAAQDDDATDDDREAFGDDEAEELRILTALADEASGYAPDWKYGETLIRDSYFETYARDLAEDIGAIDRDSKWPANCIDWDQAARELQIDYTSVDFDGVTYWIR